MQNPGPEDPNQVELETDIRSQIPPDLKICETHRKATLITTQLLKAQIQEWTQFCPCCGNPWTEDRISLCAPKTDLQHLGVSFPLYFQFLQYNILWFFLFFLITGAYDIITNIIGAFCSSENSTVTRICTKNFITILTIANKQNQPVYLRIHQWLNFAGIICLNILFQFYRSSADKLMHECEQSIETPADFTVEVEDFPKDVTKEEIKSYFTDLIKGQITVEKVHMTYSISHFVKIQREYDQLRIKQRLNKNTGVNDEILNSNISKLKQELNEIEKSSDQELEKRPFTGVAFVTFKTPKMAFMVLDRLKAGILKRLFRRFIACICCGHCVSIPLFRDSYVLEVTRAAEPSDVFWENLDSTDCQKAFRRLITNIFTLIALACSFGLSLLVNYFKSEYKKYQWLAIVAAVIIFELNIILGMVIRYFAKFERHSTLTRYHKSVAEKLSAATFINTALVVLISNALDIKQFVEGNGYEINFWGSGLMSSVTTLLLMNSFSTNLSNYFSIWHFLRWNNRRKIRNQGKDCKLTQAQANEIFEGPQIDISQRYANAMKTLLVSFFFAPAVPIVLVFSFFGQVLTYYIDFWLVVRRHAKPPQLGKELATAIADDVEWAPLAFAVGNFIFNKYAFQGGEIYEDYYVWLDIIIVIIAAAILVLPMDVLHQKILGCFCGKSEDANEKNEKIYKETRKYFIDDYDLKNPVTAREAQIEWLAYLKEFDSKAGLENGGFNPLSLGRNPSNRGGAGLNRMKTGGNKYIVDPSINHQQDIELQIQNQQPNQLNQPQQQIQPQQFNGFAPPVHQGQPQHFPQQFAQQFPQQPQVNIQMGMQPQIQMGMQPQFQMGMQPMPQGPYQGNPNTFPPNGQIYGHPNGLQGDGRIVYYGPNPGNSPQKY